MLSSGCASGGHGGAVSVGVGSGASGAGGSASLTGGSCSSASGAGGAVSGSTGAGGHLDAQLAVGAGADGCEGGDQRVGAKAVAEAADEPDSCTNTFPGIVNSTRPDSSVLAAGKGIVEVECNSDYHFEPPLLGGGSRLVVDYVSYVDGDYCDVATMQVPSFGYHTCEADEPEPEVGSCQAVYNTCMADAQARYEAKKQSCKFHYDKQYDFQSILDTLYPECLRTADSVLSRACKIGTGRAKGMISLHGRWQAC